MKNRLISAVAIAVLLSASAASIASAQGYGSVNANVKATTSVGDTTLKANVNANTNGQSSTTNNGNAGTENNGTTTRGNGTSTAASMKGQLNAETHRSTVAAFVRSLISLADRDGGIGAQVRVVAEKQNDSASTSANAIAKIEKRGKLQAFLFGTDYKSIGALRSELATTSANIAQLKNLLANASADARVELSAQIKVLEDMQAKIEAFMEARESSFSLFGWFTKQFAK